MEIRKVNLSLVLILIIFITSCGDNPSEPNKDYYEKVTIGNQIWMKKNLDISNYRNGDLIRFAGHVADWADALSKKEGAWCYYEGSAQFGKIYGKLYNWYAVNDPRGLAPEGYHIATEQEWMEMIDFIGNENIAGGKLEEMGESFWKTPNTVADNSSGFSALPGGNRNTNNGYYGLLTSRYWWTSTEFDDKNAQSFEIHYHMATIKKKSNNMGLAFSVRVHKGLN